MSKLRGVRSLNRNDRKAIQTLRSGFERWWPNLRFVTLTGVGEFNKDFPKLKRFLKRKGVLREYFAVRTAEGAGVIHLVYAGKSVRYGELSKEWASISGSWVVSISKVRNVEGMIVEMTRQHRVIRYFHSEHWDKPYETKQNNLDGETMNEYYSEKDMKFHR